MNLSLLALGDSYTIGEQVPLFDSFPYQTIQLIRKQLPFHEFAAPEIIAKTGWTTDELSQQIDNTHFLKKYDFVSLLIGVNNQYRGRDISNYKEEFEHLLLKAVDFAGGKHNHVFVLSIPDWGVTPFADGRDSDLIAIEIDQYNKACEQITLSHKCNFIDITTDQRNDKNDISFLTSDKLHPSGKEYSKWAAKLSLAMASQID